MKGAEKLLTKIMEMPEFIQLRKCQLGLSSIHRDQCGSRYVMQWICRLNNAIKNNQLVTMRQLLWQADDLLVRIPEVLAKANELPQENYQLTLFDTA